MQVKYFYRVVRGREQAAVAEDGEEGEEGVGDPAEGEAGRGVGAAGGVREGFLDNVAADDEEDGEDVGGVGPLG